MEETKKRTRNDSEDEEVYSPESKLARVNSVSSDADSTEAKRIQDDLLDILNDSDDRDPAILGLDSVIKSFEEEIVVPAAGTAQGQSCDSQPDLGFLLEASDDELGLPPSSSSGEEQKAGDVDSDLAVGVFGGMFEFDQMPNFDSLEFGIGGDSDNTIDYNDSVDFVALEGLFDYSDGSYQPADVSEILWRTESLSAL